MRMGTLGELMGKVRGLRMKFTQGDLPSKPTILDAPQQQAVGRVYEVPSRLIPRLLELHQEVEAAKRIGKGAVENYRMWRWLQDRCPELKEGNWKLDVHNWTRAEVVEVLP